MNALRFLERWAERIKAQKATLPDGRDAEITFKKSDFELLTIDGADEDEMFGEIKYVHPSVYKQDWLNQNIQFMQSAIGKATKNMIAEIDAVIGERGSQTEAGPAAGEAEYIRARLTLPRQYEFENQEPTIKRFRDFVYMLEAAFLKFLEDRNIIEALYWDKCKDIRLVNADIAQLLYQIRAENLPCMEGTKLSFLLTGGTLGGFRPRSSTLMKMFKTNEYAFQSCKKSLTGLKHENLRQTPINKVEGSHYQWLQPVVINVDLKLDDENMNNDNSYDDNRDTTSS